MRFGVRRGFREPACEHAIVGRSVATPAAPLVERSDRGKQPWNRSTRLAAQQLGLRLLSHIADEPTPEAVPPFAPRIEPLRVELRLGCFAVRRRIARFALRDFSEQMLRL